MMTRTRKEWTQLLEERLRWLRAKQEFASGMYELDLLRDLIQFTELDLNNLK